MAPRSNQLFGPRASDTDTGSKRSSIVRSMEFLKAHIRRIFGTWQSGFVLRRTITSLIIEMNGVIPLPPLIISRDSCLQKKRNTSKLSA